MAQVDFLPAPVIESHWKSEHGFMLPQRIYTVETGRGVIGQCETTAASSRGSRAAKLCPRLRALPWT